MTMRIMLHQLPPPWLLLHAAGLVWWVWRLQINIPGWWPSAPTTAEAWLQPLVFAAVGIAAVVSQEAGRRAAYIKSLGFDVMRRVIRLPCVIDATSC